MANSETGGLRRSQLRIFRAALAYFIASNIDQLRHSPFYLDEPVERQKVLMRARRWETASAVRNARPYMRYLTGDNSQLGAKELADVAAKLSWGSVHTGASLLFAAIRVGIPIDNLMKAALIYHNWTGGKVGFQFLPDPARTDLCTYLTHADFLSWSILAGHRGDPGRLLVDEDLQFYQRLPERFRVYRGAAGIKRLKASAGMCWTLLRDYAEWFAYRAVYSARQRPIVVTAEVAKADVLLAFAGEEEIALAPRLDAVKLPLLNPPTMKRPDL